MNKRYSVAQVRERLSDALDEAERGDTVIIERHGTRYMLTLAPATDRPRTTRRKPRIEIVDPAVARGEWSWAPTAKGLAFKPRRRQ